MIERNNNQITRITRRENVGSNKAKAGKETKMKRQITKTERIFVLETVFRLRRESDEG